MAQILYRSLSLLLFAGLLVIFSSAFADGPCPDEYGYLLYCPECVVYKEDCPTWQEKNECEGMVFRISEKHYWDWKYLKDCGTYVYVGVPTDCCTEYKCYWHESLGKCLRKLNGLTTQRAPWVTAWCAEEDPAK